MGQKVNPVGFRTGTFTPWKSRWFADDKNYKDFLIEDAYIRKTLMNKLKLAGINNVEIERSPKSVVITLNVSRPGVVIGRGGSGIEDVKKDVMAAMQKVRGTMPKTKIDIHVVELKSPELSANLVLNRIIYDLERRMPHRRVISKTIERVMQSGAKGVKITLSGRIAGADIARVESYHEGSVPTQTLRSEIDYAEHPALTKRGYVGVKVWIHKERND